ncbi:hypothetical protein [Leadbetterella byssophila]|uniref:hypothetical protein n=1 Tax=Leadbetterella byssophila TaxID=316068 RepID=UPI0039A027FE
MKKLYILIIFLFLLIPAFAQNNVRVNVIIPPPYPDYLSYYREPGKMVITIQNLSGARQEVYLRGIIKGVDNQREISTKPEYRPLRPIIIPQGVGQTVTVSAADIMELYKPENLNFYNTDVSRISASDRVGEGTYSICIRAYDFNAPQRALSSDQTGCTTILMRNIESPMLIQPVDEASIKAVGTQNIVFSWTRPAGTPVGTKYILKIVEIFGENRNPNDAYLAATTPAFFEKELSNNVYVYGPADPPLLAGRNYAWAVTAVESSRSRVNGNYQNEGRSEIRSFTYELPNYNISAPVVPKVITPVVIAKKEDVTPPIVILDQPMQAKISDAVICDCKETLPVGTNTTIAVNDKVKVNSFDLTVLNIEKEENGKFTGTGTIPVPFINSATIRLRVKFIELQAVNSGGAKKMVAGAVKGIRRTDMSLLPAANAPDFSPAPLSSSDIHQIDQFFEHQSSQLSSNMSDALNNIGYELPIGMNGGKYTIGITEVNFSPTQAWFNAVASMPIPDGNAKAAFEMSGACFKPTDFCGEFKLRLKEELYLPSIGMKLVPGDVQGEGTYMVFKKKFQELSIALDYTFPSGMGIMDVSTGQSATARLTAKTTAGWTDWLAKAKLPDFYISGMPSLTFSLAEKDMWYDHSDLQNPTGMPSMIKVGNETYTEIGAKTWHGFYLPELSVILPGAIKNTGRADGKALIMTKDLLIDRNGFTGIVKKAGTQPIVSIGDGSLSGWYASIDDVNLLFFKSGFRESSMTGKVVLPGTGDPNQAANQLNYTSLLTYASGEGIKYSFNIAPKDQLKFDVLFVTAHINNTSHITVQADGQNGFLAKATLNGGLSIGNLKQQQTNSIISFELPQLELKNFKLMTKAPYWDKEGFVLGFASPQKKVAGFNFTMEKPEIHLAVTDVVEAGLTFKGQLAFVDESFNCAASASASIYSKFTLENQRIKWAGLDARVNDISLAAGTTIGPLTVEGAVMYYNRQNDEGFVGALSAGVAEMFQVTMRARFGTTSDGLGKFKYFDFNALADFGQTGIPIAPPIPISFYGFGGGVYYNLKINNASQLSSNDAKSKLTSSEAQNKPSNSSGPMALLDYNPTNLQLVPSRGSFGLQATVLLGLTSRNIFDADATLSMQFNPSGGVSNIKFVGNARVLTDVSEPLHNRRKKSTGVGSLTINYDFAEKAFLTNVQVEMGVPYVDDKKWINVIGRLEIASNKSGWWIYAGRPEGYGSGPNSVKLLRKDILGGSSKDYFFNGSSYFEVGSVVDPMPDLPQDVKDLVGIGGNNQGDKLRRPAEVPGRGNYNPNKKNSGLIVGSHTRMNMSGEFLVFFADLTSLTGFDISVLNQVTCMNNPNAGGPGGWYATGQAYFGAKAKVGIKINLLLIKGKFTIFDAGAAALIKVGLPNPTYVDGYIGGYFNILDGVVKGKFNFHVGLGEECKMPADALAGIDIISEINPVTNGELVPVNTEPNVLFNLQVGKDFVLEEGPDKNGNPVIRVFLFDQDCIEASVNGKKVNLHNIGKGRDFNHLFAVNPQLINSGSSSFLDKNTTYNFKVIAYLKEAKYVKKGNQVQFDSWQFVKENPNGNKRASQSMQTTFKTDEGLDIIPENYYLETVPTHGMKYLPYAHNKPLSIRLNKMINFERNFRKVEKNSEIIIRVFENGNQIGTDLPAKIDISKGQINTTLIQTNNLPFNLKKGSKYICLLLVKNPVDNSADLTSTLLEKTGVLQGQNSLTKEAKEKFEEIRLVTRANLQNNRLLPGEFVLGGFNFTTSEFPYYEDKFNAMAVNSVTLKNESSNSPGALLGLVNSPIINNQTSPAIAKTILDKWLPKDEEGNYKILIGDLVNLPAFVTFTGETFSSTNYKENNKNDLTFVDVQGKQFTIPFFDKTLQFLSKKSGVPLEKFKVEYANLPKNAGKECSTTNYTYYTLLNTNAPGGVHPTTLPNKEYNSVDGPIINLSFANSSALTGLDFLPSMLKNVISANYQIAKSITYCKEYNALPATNIIQERINVFIDSRINPGFNSTSTWQSINQLTNSFGKGLDSQQLGQQVNASLAR